MSDQADWEMFNTESDCMSRSAHKAHADKKYAYIESTFQEPERVWNNESFFQIDLEDVGQSEAEDAKKPELKKVDLAQHRIG